MNTLSAARTYREQNFSIIPLKPGGTEPAILDWSEYRYRQPTDEELNKWFGNGSRKNIGIITGAPSGLCVVDLGCEEAVEFAEKHKFPDSPIVKTKDGYHLYYRYNPLEDLQLRDSVPGIVLHEDGSYVVAPPSVHPSGGLYAWEEGQSINDLPLVDPPVVLLAKAKNKPATKPARVKLSLIGNKAPAFQFYANDWLSSTKIALMTPAEEGAYIRLLCHAWNDPDCSLPHDDEALSVLSRLGEGWFNQSGKKIKGCFAVVGDRLVNERLRSERKKQQEWREKSRLGGINSGKSRRDKELQPKGGLSLVRTNDEPNGNTSVFSLQSSIKDISHPFSACLEVLSTIPGYPFDIQKDLVFLQEKEKDFPTVDVLLLLRAWKAYLLDEPLKKKSRPRSQLANQFELAMKWGRHQKQKEQGSQIPDSDNVLKKIQAAKRQQAMEAAHG